MMKSYLTLAALRRAFFGGILLASATGLVMAQAPTQSGAIEASGFFGASFNIPNINPQLQSGLNAVGSGFTVSGGSNFDWLGGGEFGYAISPHFLIIGNLSYNHAGGANINYGSGSSAISISSGFYLLNFTGGVQWQMPVSSKKFIPYLTGSVGGSRLTATASSAGVPGVSASQTGAAYEGGGGVRYYIKPSWGIRPEVQAVHIPGLTYVQVSGGLFWQSKSGT